jgi:hypothetical protein
MQQTARNASTSSSGKQQEQKGVRDVRSWQLREAHGKNELTFHFVDVVDGSDFDGLKCWLSVFHRLQS